MFISSGGGLELGDLEGSGHGYRAYQRHIEASAGFAQPPPREPEGPVTGPLAGEHPYGEHPSRTLFVRNINSNVEDSELRALFEVRLETCVYFEACEDPSCLTVRREDLIRSTSGKTCIWAG